MSPVRPATDANSKAVVVNWSSSLVTAFSRVVSDHVAVGGIRPARRPSTASFIARHRYLRAGRLVVRRGHDGKDIDVSDTGIEQRIQYER